MKNILLIALVAIVSLSACKKNNINGDIKNRREILVTRNWVLVSKHDNSQPVSIPDCQKDNYFVFEDNGQGRWEEGANNCFAQSGENEPPTFTSFTWSMAGDQREIHIKDFEKEGRDPEWAITNMDYNSLDIRWSEFDSTHYLHTYDLKFNAK